MTSMTVKATGLSRYIGIISGESRNFKWFLSLAKEYEQRIEKLKKNLSTMMPSSAAGSSQDFVLDSGTVRDLERLEQWMNENVKGNPALEQIFESIFEVSAKPMQQRLHLAQNSGYHR